MTAKRSSYRHHSLANLYKCWSSKPTSMGSDFHTCRSARLIRTKSRVKSVQRSYAKATKCKGFGECIMNRKWCRSHWEHAVCILYFLNDNWQWKSFCLIGSSGKKYECSFLLTTPVFKWCSIYHFKNAVSSSVYTASDDEMKSE